MAHLITGYAGYEHIKSSDQGQFNASFVGDGQFVMKIGSEMEASIINNNTVRVLDGSLIMYGRHVLIDSDTYEDLTIQTGTAGKNRIDLIVMEYSKDADDGTETAELKVIKGTESTGSATAPTYTNGNILEGATLNQMPLYKVKIEGVVLSEVVQLFSKKGTFEQLADEYEEEFQEACETYLDSLNILDTRAEINANKQANQLTGALAAKEISTAVSTLNENLTASDGLNFKFGKDGDGNYGYYGADGSLIPFKSGGELNTFSKEIWIDNLKTTTETIGIKGYKKLKGMANANVGTVTLNIYTNGGDILYSEVIYTKGVDTPNVKKDIEIPDDVYLIGDYAKITVVGGEMSTWSTYTVSYEGNN